MTSSGTAGTSGRRGSGSQPAGLQANTACPAVIRSAPAAAQLMTDVGRLGKPSLQSKPTATTRRVLNTGSTRAQQRRSPLRSPTLRVTESSSRQVTSHQVVVTSSLLSTATILSAVSAGASSSAAVRVCRGCGGDRLQRQLVHQRLDLLNGVL